MESLIHCYSADEAPAMDVLCKDVEARFEAAFCEGGVLGYGPLQRDSVGGPVRRVEGRKKCGTEEQEGGSEMDCRRRAECCQDVNRTERTPSL